MTELQGLLRRLLSLLTPALITLQAFVLAWLSPAQWLGWLNLNRSNVLWTILPPPAEHQPPGVRDEELKEETVSEDRLHQLLETLKAVELEGYRVLRTWHDGADGRAGLKAWRMSPWFKWVDVMQIELTRTQGECMRGLAAWQKLSFKAILCIR